MKAAVIGSGMAGILAAIELKKAGIDVVVFEKASRLGGTWRDNSYPGLSCDVPAHSYTFSFARNPDWSQHYAPGPEIREYFERVADEFGITSCIRFNSEVVSLVWEDTRWKLETNDGFVGEFPYVFELPDVATGCRLMAFSTARETTTVKVYGYDYQNNEVMEELPINTFHAGTEGRIEGEYRTGNTLVGSTYFKEISKVIKMETSAAITLYAVNPDTEQIWFVAKYHMKDKVPMFRRYRIVNKKYHTGEADDPKYSTCILAMVKLGHVELHDDDDIVPIDSEAALKLMLIAIKYENDGNLSQAVNYEAKAMQVLQDAISNHSLTQGTPVVIDFQTKLMGGRTLNIRRALI